MPWSWTNPACPRFTLSHPRTYFGKEVEVAAHTHLDTHRVEMPRNHWMLVTGSPRKEATTMLDVPKPPVERVPAPELETEQAATPGAP